MLSELNMRSKKEWSISAYANNTDRYKNTTLIIKITLLFKPTAKVIF